MNKFKPFKKLNYRLILMVAPTILGYLSIEKAIAHDHVTVLFQPRPENEQPEETEGAASRQLGECAANSLASQSAINDIPNLTALVPQDNHGFTIADRPNFWVYLPETSAKQAILTIKQKDKTPHWQQLVELSGKAGITGIKLSNDAPALEIGKQYQWAVILVCGNRPSPNDPVVAAWIERVPSAKVNPVDSTTEGLEKASSYAQQGIWYDALNALIEVRSPSNSWNNIWSDYLKSGGLARVADEPIIGNLLPTK